ncbi:MAG: T9SS type A sorting domain-containing protein [Candidatus Marinimicrobia bacterium]|nr:T9SS type A sorting domain-containing protein [Candidatus Neomarinimicrobiota bacterium]
MPEYSIDSGVNWTIAQISGNIINLTPQLYSGSFFWHSGEDLPGIDITTARFRITPIDANDGLIAETDDFHLDNNDPPEIISLTIPPGELSGSINISLISSDAEDDTLNYIYDFSSDSGATWNSATIDEPILQLGFSKQINLHKSELSISSIDLLDTLSINWLSEKDLPNQDLTSAVFRVTPADNDTGSSALSDLLHVDNQTGPTVIDYLPFETALWNDTVFVYLERSIDTSTIEGNISLISSKSGIVSGTVSYEPVENLLIFNPRNSFTGLDTIEVVIAGEILDSLGNGLDGDGDGDPEGSPEDDFTWTFLTPLVADYDFSNTIDFEDLAVFASAWNSDPQDLSKEIGPATGTVPNLTPLADGKLDFEDLVVFLQMGTWSSQNSLSKLSKNINASKIATLNDYIKIEDPKYASNGITKLKIKTTQETDLEVMSLELNYDPNEFELINITASPMLTLDGEQIVFLKEELSDSGKIIINLARLRNNREADLSAVDEILEISFKIKNVLNGDIYIRYDIRQSGNIHVAKGTSEINIKDLIVPQKFTLFQNYPNPFNPVTLIRYGLPTASDVSLIIYNLNGQEVIRWESSDQMPGFYERKWNGTNKHGISISSGIYLYRLQAGDFVQTKKMVLLK